MAVSTVYKNFRDGTILIEDGTGVPLDVTVQFEAGDLSISGLSADQKDINPYLDRGDLASLRYTNQNFPTFSFTASATDFSDGTDENLLDMIRQTGAFAAAVSTFGANAEVYTLKMTLTVEGTNHGDAADHTVVLDDCALTIDFAEGDPNTFTVNGTCYGTITFT